MKRVKRFYIEAEITVQLSEDRKTFHTIRFLERSWDCCYTARVPEIGEHCEPVALDRWMPMNLVRERFKAGPCEECYSDHHIEDAKPETE
ncbi:MAG: hypothetical protein Q8Q12_00620 [bacterium]|nr:hypothetical protein [bacterium]